MFLLIFVAYLLKFLCRASERGRKKSLWQLIKRVSWKVDNFFFFQVSTGNYDRFEDFTVVVQPGFQVNLSFVKKDFKTSCIESKL